MQDAGIRQDDLRLAGLRRGAQAVIASLVDVALEISVIGSFSRIGPAVRRRAFRWQDPQVGVLAGRTLLVTGATSGLGLTVTREVAALGARVVLVGRSDQRLVGLRDELMARHGEDRFPIVAADMGSLASVRAAVARILDTEPRLDVVIDNAGAIYPERTEGPDGIEATLAVLVVGPFVLIDGLRPLLERTPSSRVIAVTSGGMYAQRLDLDDLGSRSGQYAGVRAYARAKRAQTALVRERARRFAGTGVSYAVMHPGWADTPGLADSLPSFYRLMRPLLRTPEEGADTIIWLATTPEPAATSGRLYLDRRPRPFDRVRSTRLSAADRSRLWQSVTALAGLPQRRARHLTGCRDQARRFNASSTAAAASTTRLGSSSVRRSGTIPASDAAPPTAMIGTDRAMSASMTAVAAGRSSAVTTPMTAARAWVRAKTSIQPSMVTSWPR